MIGYEEHWAVATTPTVYGIETTRILLLLLLDMVATTPTVYGIETCNLE